MDAGTDFFYTVRGAQNSGDAALHSSSASSGERVGPADDVGCASAVPSILSSRLQRA